MKYIRIALLSAFVLFVIYLCGVMIFWNRFSIGFSVNGRSMAFQSPEEVTLDLLLETESQQFIFIKNDGMKEYVSFRELGIYRESDDAFVDWKLSSWNWFLTLFEKQDYVLQQHVFYDREELCLVLEQLPFVTGCLDKDISKLSVVEKDGQYEIVYVNQGSYIDTDRLLQVICEHLENQDFMIDLVAEDCYQTCDIRDLQIDADMTAREQNVNVLLSNQIILNVDSGVQEVLPEAVLSSCLYQDGDVWRINPHVLAGYVRTLAEKYDTVGDVRQFVKQDGSVLELVPKDTDTFYGYELNQEALLLSLLNAVSSGDNASISVPWYTTGRSIGDLDIGNTYIEISISDQHLWCFVDGQCIIDTDVVTGRDTDEFRTPVGLFSVLSLQTNYQMYYQDGSAKAAYFIKLTGDGVGIHDSQNRSSYGGTIWMESGSHGCINVPYDVEKQIFESLEQMRDFHVPVVIY